MCIDLKTVLSIQSYSWDQYRMFSFLIRHLSKLQNVDYYTYNGCIYVTKGEGNYPCIVAHMDTVHEIVEDLHPIEFNGNITGFNRVTMKQTGIGGDDKVGIYIALQCLEKFENIKLVFFRDEEVGCEGSQFPDMDFFKDVNYILQCDRRGNSGFVTEASGVKLSSNEFQTDITPIIRQYGYSFVNGAMTDVMELRYQGINISMANIECGYYNPHQYNEYVNIGDVEICKYLVFDIFETLKKRYDVEPHKKQTYKKFFSHKKYDDWDYPFLEDDETVDYCDSCLNEATTIYLKDYNMHVCKSCADFELKF